MTVYIEVVFLDNFLIDGVLLYLSLRLTGTNIKWVRLILASVTGAIGAILLSLVYMPFYLSLPVKLGVGVVLLLLATGRLRLKKWIKCLSVFYGLTTLFGGLCYAFFGAIRGGIFIYHATIPVGIILFGVVTGSLLAVSLVRYIEKRRQIYPFLYTMRVSRGDAVVEYKAFLDSGNRLYAQSGEPVCVISFSAASKLLGGDIVALYLKNGASISAYAADGKKMKMLVFSADKADILCSGHVASHDHVQFAISPHEFGDTDEYEVLLNPEML